MPKAIVNADDVSPVTMEEVAYRLTDALVKVVSNKGASGPDRQTVEALREQWPTVLPRLQASLLDGSYRPGVIRRAALIDGTGERGTARSGRSWPTSIPSTTATHEPNIREYVAARFNTILRFDAQMLVTLHLWAQPTSQAPLLHLQRRSENGLFDRFAAHYDALWHDASTPVEAAEQRDGQPTGSRSQFRTWRRMNLAATCRRRSRRPTIPPDHDAGPGESNKSHRAFGLQARRE